MKKVTQSKLNSIGAIPVGEHDSLNAPEVAPRTWLDDMPACTKVVDSQLNLRYMSEAGVQALNIDDITEYYGSPYPFEFYPESFKEHMTASLETARATGQPVAQEDSVVDLEGNELWYQSTISPIFNADGTLEHFIVVSIETTDRHRAEDLLRNEKDKLRTLASDLVLAEERKRKRIAMILHEDLCQNLVSARMRLDSADQSGDTVERAKFVAEARSILEQTVQDVRAMTFDLGNPTLNELGLEKALSQWLTEKLEKQSGITTEFHDDGQEKPMTEEIRSLLYRSVQELLTNIIKHSQAKQAELGVSRVGDDILICVQDDGIGFDPDRVVTDGAHGGFGLFSIRERINQMGGTLKIDSSPGCGCRTTLRVSLASAQDKGEESS